MQRRELLKASILAAATMASPSVAGALRAGVTAGSAPAKAAFTAAERETVSLLSEMIIPATDTPGAIQAGVPAFIETIVGEWYRPTEHGIFRRGLKALDEYCEKQAGRSFRTAPQALRIAALRESEKQAAAYPSAAGGSPLASFGKVDENTPFFTKIKELVVLGYYTSEVGAKQELAYNPAPGRFEGDYDFDKVGRQWSS